MKTVNFEITDNEKKKKIYDCTYIVIQACVIASCYDKVQYNKKILQMDMNIVASRKLKKLNMLYSHKLIRENWFQINKIWINE